jgi:pilus assembly protein CpaE
LNAKGGSGATTIAVNTALALQENHGSTVLVDFGILGHAALHLNVRPSFGLTDALQNLHRMDTGLLEGFITHCKRDLSLLAGLKQLMPLNPTGAELARLFDLLVTHYRYVVVDCSSRTDDISRLMCDLSDQILLVAQTDVAALWSAGRIQSWLAESNSPEKLAMVLNRYKKIPGFTDEDVEKGTNCRVLWKVPNNYHSVAGGIDRGEPVLLQDSEISRSVRGLASALVDSSSPESSAVGSEQRNDLRKKVTARFLPSPLRAGQ